MPPEADGILHPLLTRQMRRLGLAADGAPPGVEAWPALLERVSRSYREADQERYTNERSLELSSQEMQELYANLSVERDRLRSLIAAVGYGLVLLDPQGRVTFANPEAEALLGWSAAELGAQDVFALLEGDAANPEGSLLRDAFVREVIAQGLPARAAEATFARRDGSRVPVSWAMNPFEQNGRVTGAYLIFHDDTHHKRIEDELRRALHDAAAASRAKSEFLDNMSHELRTPMNGVLGTMELLLAMPLPPEQRELVEVAQRSGEGLLQILVDLLDFSKLEAGKMQLEERPYDAGALVAEVAQLLARSAAQKGLELRVRVAPEVPPLLLGDAARTRQIVVNLLGNAIKFTQRGHVAVAASVVEEGATAWFQLEVADTGIGIAPEVQARLFQPFTQADGAMNRRFGGTGLGLAITQRLAEVMHGRVSVTSAPGEGSTFRVQLPLVEAPATAIPVAAPPVAPEPELAGRAPAEHSFAGLRVLVVEDNTVNQRVIRRLLEGFGCEVALANDGVEGVEACGAHAYDVVFMDCQMPNMDGFQATHAIREGEGEGRRVPIVAVTANALAGDRERCLAAGMDDFLTKPIKATGLAAALERWVSHGGDAGEVRAA